MHKIVAAEFLAPDIKRFEIEAPKIAQKRKAGQFVIIRVSSNGERIPLTIAGSDVLIGTITIIVQGIGKTTKEMNMLNAGDCIQDIAGPLGKPSHIQKYGTVVIVGGGVGTAIAYPVADALKKAGNKTISIIGGRTKEFVILDDEMRKVCDEVFFTTDDGSYGYHGFVTDKLKEIILSEKKIDFILAIGPIPMMKAVANLTKEYGIKTVVSLNPIMVDGTGMCGGCRAEVGGKTVFVCVDGPEFDAHEVNFEIMERRNRSYLAAEEEALKNHLCRLNLNAT
ncbi:MAG: sulfide/dihydroorotate dehydrogenase-like FAD/NAD-binding protein [Ignavibacteria bacterium]